MRKAIIVLLSVLAGCAPVWQRTGGPFHGAGYTMDLPQGWMATRDSKDLIITRDGPELQAVYVYIGDLNDQDRDKDAGKRVKKGMLPQEAAETVLDIMRSDKRLARFAVAENKPAQVGGKDGFRLVYTFKSGKVRRQCIYYGMLQDDRFCRISYCAPVRYYFEKDAAAFEKIVASFRVDEGKSGERTAGK